MSLLDKLESVIRYVNIIDKSDIVVDEVKIPDISLTQLLEIVTPIDDDPNLYTAYELNLNQLAQLNYFLDNKIEVNLNLYYYYLVSEGMYNWD